MYRIPGGGIAASGGSVGALAATGADVGWWIALGAVLVLLGVLAIVASYRRNRRLAKARD